MDLSFSLRNGTISKKYLGIFFAALACRILFLSQWSKLPYQDQLVVDAKYFDDWAVRIAQGNWLPEKVFYQSPLYAYFLALIYKIFGHQLIVVQIIQAVAGSFTALMIAVIADSIFKSPVGLAAGLIAALYKPFIFSDALILKSTWELFFSALFIFYALKAQNNPLKKYFFFTGFWLGIAALLRGNMLFLVPFILFWWLIPISPGQKFGIRYIFEKKYIVMTFFYILGFFIPIFPVTMSNIILGKDTVLITSTGGATLWVANNPQATGYLSNPSDFDVSSLTAEKEEEYFKALAESEEGKELKPSEVSRFWGRKAMRYISDHPLSWLKLTFRKFLLFWNYYEFPDNYNLNFFENEFQTILRYSLFSFGIIAPFSILGFFLLWKQGRNPWLLMGCVLIYMGSLLAFYVSDRYRLPALVFLIPMASYAVTKLISDFFHWKLLRLSYGISALIGFWFFCTIPLVDAKIHLADTYSHLGYVYYGQKQYDKAEEAYQKSIALNRNDIVSYYNLGLNYQEQKKFEQAIKFYEKALGLNPNFFEAHYNLGNLYLDLKQFSKALHHNKIALKLSPGPTETKIIEQKIASIEKQRKKLK